MQRRTFLNMAGGVAMTAAFKPNALADGQESKHLVLYPDAAVEVD